MALQRASRLLSQLPDTCPWAHPKQVVASAWPKAVGARLAQRTGPVQLVRTTLIVAVDDAIWQKQLWSLRQQVLAHLQKLVGGELVTELEFRVRLQRKAPQREEGIPQRAENHDEADGITDPYLRQLYLASWRRALA